MLDSSPISTMPPAAKMQRARGDARVGLVLDGTRMRLTDLRQAGSAKAMLPHVGALPEVVFLNTAGGLTGGDEMSYRLDLGAGGARFGHHANRRAGLSRIGRRRSGAAHGASYRRRGGVA